jgi:endonuclease III related protein
LRQLGSQGWWPARTRLEVVLGAILTQNTTWHNAARAIERLREASLLKWFRLRKASAAQLEAAVRPAGYFRQKALTIRSFTSWLERTHRGSLNRLLAQPPAMIRAQLLNRRGLGPETADAILLYAGKQPYFVADAYTRRILSRHGLISTDATYAEAQDFLHHHLPPDAALMGEFHALLVEAGKHYCRRHDPRCKVCPLGGFLSPARRRRLRQQLQNTITQRTGLGARNRKLRRANVSQ